MCCLDVFGSSGYLKGGVILSGLELCNRYRELGLLEAPCVCLIGLRRFLVTTSDHRKWSVRTLAGDGSAFDVQDPIDEEDIDASWMPQMVWGFESPLNSCSPLEVMILQRLLTSCECRVRRQPQNCGRGYWCIWQRDAQPCWSESIGLSVSPMMWQNGIKMCA